MSQSGYSRIGLTFVASLLLSCNVHAAFKRPFLTAAITITQQTHIDDKGYVATKTTVVEHATGKTTTTASPLPAELAFENMKQETLAKLDLWIQEYEREKRRFERYKKQAEGEWAWLRSKDHGEKLKTYTEAIAFYKNGLAEWREYRKFFAEKQYGTGAPSADSENVPVVDSVSPPVTSEASGDGIK